MTLKMTKRGQLDNEVAYEFVCDTTTDLQAIDPKYVTMGSVATVIEGDAGFEVYMANSQKEWVNLGSAANSSGDSSGNNNSTPAWVNQDIITSIPATVNAPVGGTPTDLQTNIQLNNHTITGNITALGETQDDASLGILSVNIDPSLIDSVMVMETELDTTKEYYFISGIVPASAMENAPEGIEQLNTLVYPMQNHFDDPTYDIHIQLYSVCTSLVIHKLPGYLIEDIYGAQQYSYLVSSVLSNIQPEAIYDISQLTYIPQEAGE